MPGGEERAARSHFEAFHRDVRFDYPPRKGGARHIVAGIVGMFGIVFFALAFAAWMDPALVPQGARLVKAAGTALGLERRAGPPKESGEEFGISRGELPYDGNAVPDATNVPAKPPEPAPSSGNSETPRDDSGGSAPATEAISAPASAADEAKPEETVPTPAPAPEVKPTPSAKPHPKQTASASSTRKKEISRLRRQAEEEMYAE